jgi:hypothetical protein
MHQAESSSSLFCLWTGRSLPAALHSVSRRRSCLPLRTDQCFCPIGTFTLLLVRTRTAVDLVDDLEDGLLTPLWGGVRREQPPYSQMGLGA